MFVHLSVTILLKASARLSRKSAGSVAGQIRCACAPEEPAMMNIRDQQRFRTSLQHPASRGLFDFWLLTASIDDLPRISDIRPEHLLPWSGSIVMIKALSRRDFSYRFYGHDLRKAFGVDMTGWNIDKLPKTQAEQLRAEYSSVARKQMPVSRVHSDQFQTGRQSWERVALPFVNADGDVALIVAGAHQV